MKLDDHSQNLGARVATIHIIAVILLTVLGVRLYYLQVVRHDYYTEKATNQRIRQLRTPAPRGAIFDRFGRILVDSRSTYNILISRETLKDGEVSALFEPLSAALEVDPDYLREKLNALKGRPEFDVFVIKENATMPDIAWVEAHQLEYPGLRIELQPQRVYPNGASAAHLLGYVGEISPKQLEDPNLQAKGFMPGDILGKDGVESYYDDYLRGRPGYRRVLVDSRGRVRDELETAEPQPGQDLITTIDLDLQQAAEEQLAKSSTKRGVIIAINPNTGEILALASAPTFDPNDFVQKIGTREGRAKIAEYYQNKDKPLLNRATRGRYFPGSTWKIPMSVAGFQQGLITEQDNSILCGGGITIGSKFTRCMGNHGNAPLRYAITKSCDGYYYRLGIKMDIDGYEKMVEMFEFDKRTGVDLPGEYISRTPKYYRQMVEKRTGRWLQIDSVFSSIGQVYVEVTPIALLRAISTVGVDGKMFVPHLLKEFKEIGAVGDADTPTYREARPTKTFDFLEPKQIPLTPGQDRIIKDGMIGAVKVGTAKKAALGGFEIAGKTGTAQVVALGQDTGHKKDHAWFVSYAPAEKPEIAIVALIENSGFGGDNAAPAARGVYQKYLEVRHKYNAEVTEPTQIAQNTEVKNSPIKQ